MMSVRFVKKNTFGVIDHFVSPEPGITIFVPMRVVPNGKGSEMLFTLFQMPGMTNRNYAADLKLVKKDLRTLKKVLEK